MIGTAAEPTTAISGYSFIKAGAGRLTLFGTAASNLGFIPGTSRPTVSIAEGALTLGNAQGLLNSTVNGVSGVLPDIVLGTPAIFDVSALSSPVRVRSVTGYGAVELGGVTMQTGDQSIAYGGRLVGAAAANVVIGTPQTEAPGNTFGGNTMTLIGDNTGYAGGFTVVRGTLALNGSLAAGSGNSPIVLGDTSGNGQALLNLGAVLTSFSRDIVVQAGATPTLPHSFVGAQYVNIVVSSNISLGQTLQLNLGSSNAGTYFLAGPISGPGSLQQNNGNIVYSGANTFAGGLDVNAGQLAVVGLGSDSTASAGPLGNGPVRLGVSCGAFLAYGGPRTLTNSLMTTGATTNFTIVGTHPLTFANSLDYSTLTSPLRLSSLNTDVATFGGVVTGTQPVQKNGPGTVVFASSTGNSYSGGTVVNAGTLLVANLTGSGTGTGQVSVNDGAILGGTGRIAGATTLASGGILRAGADEVSAGILTLDNGVVAQSNSILSVILNGSTAGKVAVTSGTLDLTSAASFSIYVTGTAPPTAQSYTIADSNTTPIAFFSGAFSPANFTLSANFAFGSLMLERLSTYSSALCGD